MNIFVEYYKFPNIFLFSRLLLLQMLCNFFPGLQHKFIHPREDANDRQKKWFLVRLPQSNMSLLGLLTGVSMVYPKPKSVRKIHFCMILAIRKQPSWPFLQTCMQFRQSFLSLASVLEEALWMLQLFESYKLFLYSYKNMKEHYFISLN